MAAVAEAGLEGAHGQLRVSVPGHAALIDVC